MYIFFFFITIYTKLINIFNKLKIVILIIFFLNLSKIFIAVTKVHSTLYYIFKSEPLWNFKSLKFIISINGLKLTKKKKPLKIEILSI